MAFNVGAAPVGVLARALTGNIFVEKSFYYYLKEILFDSFQQLPLYNAHP